VKRPLSDAFGRIGPTVTLEIANKTFEAPLLWQDWSLWQQLECEQRYGTTAAFQRYWLGLEPEVDEDEDPLAMAQSLADKAREMSTKAAAVEAGEVAPEAPGQGKPPEALLMQLGTVNVPIKDQAFYAYVLLAPWDSELTNEDRRRGPEAWLVDEAWVMSYLTMYDLTLLLMQIMVQQYVATGGELADEEGVDKPFVEPSSPECPGSV